MEAEKDWFQGVYHVVGYHLAITPTVYEIEFKHAENGQILMISRFNVSPKNACCIPFCCLWPCCKRRKQVIDHFDLDDPNTLRLTSTSAFCGLISCCEKGKVFQVSRAVPPFMILINDKEIFVLSPFEDEPSAQSKMLIGNVIVQALPGSVGVGIRY